MVSTNQMNAEGSLTPGQVRSGIAWITVIGLLRDLIQFGVTVVLVRRLDARTYGEAALVNAVLAVFTVLSFRGFLEHTLQARPGESVDYQMHFTFGALTQGIAIAGLNLAASLVRGSATYGPLAAALRTMSIFFVVDWAGELRVKMLERDLAWNRLRSLEAIGLAMSAVTAVGLAWGGAGIYALLLPGVVASLPFVCDLFFIAGWRPDWGFSWQSFRPAWRYGLTRMASGIVARGQQLIESAFLAGLIGVSALGTYGRAVGLASFLCLKITSLGTSTLFPMVTRLTPDSDAFRRASAMVLRVVAWVSIPVAVLGGVVAVPLVRLLYGEKWNGAAPLLPWALAITCVAALMEAGAFLLLTHLLPGKTLAIDVINLGGTALALWLLLPHGIVPYMGGLLALQAVLLALALRWLLRSGAVSRHSVWTAFRIPASCGLCVAGGVWLVGEKMRATLDAPPGAVGFALLFVLVYLAALRVLAAAPLREALRYVPGGEWLTRRLAL